MDEFGFLMMANNAESTRHIRRHVNGLDGEIILGLC